MKQSNFFLALVLTLALNVSYSQVGIGTTTPKTTLQVEGNPANTTTADGIQGPSLSLAELDAKIAAYGADQDGAIVYIDDVTTASTTTQTTNITATGYYYYDAPNGVFKNLHAITGGITETDPVFGAWDKSTGISITESQISDLQSYLTTEVDGSVTNEIQALSISNDTIYLSNGGFVKLPAEVDGSVTNEIELPTSGTAGDMAYWNGTAWVTIAATTNEGATLQMIGGVPTWTGGTPSTPNVTNPTTGEIWMDRNLGASQVATSSTDAAAFGDLYQWGRAADGHESRTSGTTSTLATSNTPGHGNFILSISSPFDWRNPQNDNLWQGVSGTNNPCPSGYRLPTEAEWEAERTSWSSSNAVGAFASPLKLPVAGFRYYSDGTLYSVGSLGGYWSSTVNGTYARVLGFDSSNASMSSDDRALGLSVRCLKD